MNIEDIIKDIDKAINYLNDVDCYDITEMKNNAKRVHKAYDLLGMLKEKILGYEG